MIFLIDISFLTMRFLDVLDFMVVGYLIFLVYRLLKGTVAFNIFAAVLLLYALWWLVRALKMDLLALLLTQFVNVGVLIIAVVFQPELRRFLLLLGKSLLKGRSTFITSLLNSSNQEIRSESTLEIRQIAEALLELSATQTGALIILANQQTPQTLIETGVRLDATLTRQLLVSIFQKDSPLHDGAVIISNYKIAAASCILPITESADMPQSAGLRHRAALGVTENSNFAAFVVSEENGKISYAHQAKLTFDLDENDLSNILTDLYG
jgi:diadenylate cyclase